MGTPRRIISSANFANLSSVIAGMRFSLMKPPLEGVDYVEMVDLLKHGLVFFAPLLDEFPEFLGGHLSDQLRLRFRSASASAQTGFWHFWL